MVIGWCLCTTFYIYIIFIRFNFSFEWNERSTRGVAIYEWFHAKDPKLKIIKKNTKQNKKRREIKTKQTTMRGTENQKPKKSIWLRQKWRRRHCVYQFCLLQWFSWLHANRIYLKSFAGGTKNEIQCKSHVYPVPLTHTFICNIAER